MKDIDRLVAEGFKELLDHILENGNDVEEIDMYKDINKRILEGLKVVEVKAAIRRTDGKVENYSKIVYRERI